MHVSACVLVVGYIVGAWESCAECVMTNNGTIISCAQCAPLSYDGSLELVTYCTKSSEDVTAQGIIVQLSSSSTWACSCTQVDVRIPE